MNEVCFLGLDIGTYEAKGVLVNENGVVVCSRQLRHNLTIPRVGWAEHDAEVVWWRNACTLIGELLENSSVAPEQIKAVGCSAIGPCVLPLNSEGRPLRNAILYGIDTRSSNEIAKLERTLGRERIFDTCGNVLSTQSAGPKILWLKDHEPDIFEMSEHFVTATTFIVSRLTDRYWIDHYTAAAGYTPLYNVHTMRWDETLCDGLVDPLKLPGLGWATDIAGHVTHSAAQDTGLKEGTPVVIGTADAAAEAVSVGVVKPGQTMLMYGSTTFMIIVNSSYTRDARLWSAPYLFPGTYALSGGMATTGALTQWFNEQLARDLDFTPSGNGYQTLIDEARHVPAGAEGLLTLPYFSGERTPIQDPHARGVIVGLTLSHTRAHIYRAMLEGIGHGIRQHLEVFAEVHEPQTQLVAVGGGTQNPLWLEVVSDICNIEQIVPTQTIGASYGDAFLAALGVGHIQNESAINLWVEVERTIKSNPVHLDCYNARHHLFRELYLATKPVVHGLKDV